MAGLCGGAGLAKRDMTRAATWLDMESMSTTLVVQSYRTRNVPEWIVRCIQSVVKWAKASGHTYEFVDDTLFDLIPTWYRDRCGVDILRALALDGASRLTL